jgi:hypothetical protein
MGRRTVALGVATIGAVAVGVLTARGLRVSSRLRAVPKELTTRAEVPGIPGARYWTGVAIEPFVRDVLKARDREAKPREGSGLERELPAAALLGCRGEATTEPSGQGCSAAGASRGTAPSSRRSRGISTGALIAPFDVRRPRV